MAKKEATFESISRDIAARQFQPVYVFMGEEPYFIDKLTDLLIENVLDEAERDFNQTIFYGADTTAVDVIQAARRFPMMSAYQLVVLKEAQLMRDLETLAQYVKKPLASTILVINYKKISDYRMPAFISTLLQQRGVAIDAKASQMLTDFLGNDLNRLDKELDKLALLMPQNAPKRITPELIERNIGISKDYNNFELLRAIATKDILKANRIASYFAKNPKSNPIQATLAVLFNYFANLMICYYTKDRSEAGLMVALGLRGSFQAKDYLIGLKNYSAMKVFKLIGEIRDTDARSKGVNNSSATDEELLKELLYRILH